MEKSSLSKVIKLSFLNSEENNLNKQTKEGDNLKEPKKIKNRKD